MGAAIINKFMDMIGMGNQDDEYENDDVEMEYDNDSEVEEEAYEKPVSKSRRSFSEIQESPYSAKNYQSKVIPMNTAVSSSKMVISQPSCYEDVQEIGEYLKNKKSVIINLESVSKEEARRILDFLSGAAFMVEGTIQSVSNLIYLIAPRNIEIQNDAERGQYKQQQKMSFSWLK